jgi:hypothetical protein
MSAHTLNLVAFAALTLAFQAFSLKAFASSISVSGLGMLAIGFAFGPWQAVVVAALAAGVHAAIRRPAWYKVAFNVACFSLSAGAAAAFYRGFAGAGHSTIEHLGVALGASCIFLGLNAGLLATAMALSERRSLVRTWQSRLGWISPAYLTFGPLAFLAALAYEHGAVGGPLVLAASAALTAGALRSTFGHVMSRRETRELAAVNG